MSQFIVIKNLKNFTKYYFHCYLILKNLPSCKLFRIKVNLISLITETKTDFDKKNRKILRLAA